MKERDFGRQIETMLDYYGWIWKHDETAQRPGGGFATAFKGRKGFPDYVAVRRDRVLVAEIKSEKGRVSDEQKIWLAAFESSGKVETYLWRPSDLSSIAEILR